MAALRERVNETRGEPALAEKRLVPLLDPARDSGDGAAGIRLNGRCIAYVGGRTSLAPPLRKLVAHLDGRFDHHDGGIEQSPASLEDILQRADLVFCPVDCVSHDACQHASTSCRRYGGRFMPLRSASISAFAAGLERAVNHPVVST